MAAGTGPGITYSVPGEITVGKEMQRGFINDNILHSPEHGDIHYSSYIPEAYDGTKSYALFVTLPGWEGLYFQGVGANMVEDFGVEAIQYNDEMIVLSTQLNDWGETSADQAIALTEFFLAHYNIDPEKVYLHGYSGGGETGSLVMAKRPELYTAFLCCATQWDGNMTSLLTEGLTEREIDSLLILDIKEEQYFTARGFTDQHMGGQAFAKDKSIMGWLFGAH